MTTLSETLKYLYDLQFFGMKLGLDNIRELCEFLGQPQNRYPSVHVAGTNGKGTTCACLEAIFREARLKTGLYTSPHIHHFSERIRMNGRSISDEDIIRCTDKMRPRIDSLRATFFEAATAMAFQYFADHQADIAVIETGLGGRLDATNVITPEVCIITSIDLDHTEHLGNNKKQIAKEKGGIIKPGIPVILGDTDPDVINVIRRIAEEKSSQLILTDDHAKINILRKDGHGTVFNCEFTIKNKRKQFDNLFIPFPGEHQVRNAVMALLAASSQNRFEIPDEAIIRGLGKSFIKGRMEWIAPNIVLDAAHNPASLSALKKLIDSALKSQFNNITIIIGLLADKDIDQCISAISGAADRFYCVTPNNPRAYGAQSLAERFMENNQTVSSYESVDEAVRKAKKKMGTNDLLIITGSHFVLSEVK